MSSPIQSAEGPYFDELAVGQKFTTAPSITITTGLAAAHQAIVGERLRLALDTPLAIKVTGGQFAPPALVWNLAIGQSTLATHHVKANLFYRGLSFRSAPRIGDTLHTITEVVGLRENQVRPGRRPTGLAALRITTTDQDERPVLDFVRCAMLPLRDSGRRTGHADDLDAVSTPPPDFSWLADWQLTTWPGAEFTASPGERWVVEGGDVVSSAPELARLTLNIAQVHHDRRAADGQRLVYGGHTIGIALAQTTRAFADVLTVVGWHSCDHLGPVNEDDTLFSEVEIERVEPLVAGLRLAHLRSRVRAVSAADDQPRDVLDWRFIAAVR